VSICPAGTGSRRPVSRCGHAYPAAAKLCDQCGAARLACDACMSGGAKFCSSCGSALGAKAPADADGGRSRAS
jgi:hypothetical protein